MKVHGNLDVKGELTEQGQPVSGSVTFTDGSTTKTSDTLRFSEDEFYLSGSTNGGVVLNATPSINFADGTRDFNSKTFHVNDTVFYLSNTTSGEPVLNKNAKLYAVMSDSQIQTIEQGNEQKVFDTNVVDVGGWVDLANNRFVVPSGLGIAQVKCLLQGTFSSNSGTAKRRVFLQLNGVDPPGVIPSTAMLALATDLTQLQVVSHIFPVGEGDLITMWLQNDDVADAPATQNGNNWFQIEDVR